MRNLFLISVSTIISFSIAGLITPEKHNVNTTYFILGTLSDNMGRFYYINKGYEVDRYDTYELPLLDYLDKLIQKEFKIELITISDSKTPDKYETYSKNLSVLLNSFYGKDSMLIDGLFKNSEEISSFLMGKYYRYGRKINDSIYVIQLANSPNHKLIDSLLRRVGCYRIHFKNLRDTPVQFIYYFVPSPELERYFEKISKQKEKLNDSYNDYMMKLLVMEREEFNKIRKDLNDKEILEITKVFKDQ